MDKFRIDSHKLMYHIPRVHEWMQGKNIYPIYMEISLSGGCNQHCNFCAFDFLGYKSIFLEIECLKKFISEASQKGVKSILYSGEGEPLLHKDVVDIIAFTKKKNIDVALATNGVLLDKDRANNMLAYLTWLRVSLNAGTDKTYALVHGTRKEEFNIVLRNIEEAVRIKDKNRFTATVGIQFLLLPYNYREVFKLAKIARDIGVDYLTIKPYSQHPLSYNKVDSNFKYKSFFYLEEKLKKYSGDNFKVIFRRRAMEKLEKEKVYNKCLGLPFASFITTNGDMYPCNVFFNRKEFIFGNICNQSFEDIWQGDRRKEIMARIDKEWDIKNNCRSICRLDEINNYLWELKYPSAHANFI